MLLFLIAIGAGVLTVGSVATNPHPHNTLAVEQPAVRQVISTPAPKASPIVDVPRCSRAVKDKCQQGS